MKLPYYCIVVGCLVSVKNGANLRCEKHTKIYGELSVRN